MILLSGKSLGLRSSKRVIFSISMLLAFSFHRNPQANPYAIIQHSSKQWVHQLPIKCHFNMLEQWERTRIGSISMDRFKE